MPLLAANRKDKATQIDRRDVLSRPSRLKHRQYGSIEAGRATQSRNRGHIAS
jgi:hypothetical protein